jgi:hypothetical protein
MNGLAFKKSGSKKSEGTALSRGSFSADRSKIKPAIERFRASASGRRMMRARSKFLSRLRSEFAESFLESITGVSPNIIKLQNLMDNALEHLLV